MQLSKDGQSVRHKDDTGQELFGAFEEREIHREMDEFN